MVTSTDLFIEKLKTRINPTSDGSKSVQDDNTQTLIGKKFEGDIEYLSSQKIVQSTDNSIYQLQPNLILYPKHSHDIEIILYLINLPQFSDLKITARGGTTSTNGQSLNNGVIIDCTRYFREIIKLNIQEEWIEVEPGITLKEVNDFLQEHNYHFAPNISPSDRATIGGMISTDASGKGSYVYGKTSDHLISVSTLLPNRTKYTFKNHLNNITDNITKQINKIISENIKLIRKKFPEHKRFASGYNLSKLINIQAIGTLTGNRKPIQESQTKMEGKKPEESNNISQLIENKNINLNYLIAGSEGTLGIITKAKLKITPLPKYESIVITHYKNFDDCLKDAKNILPFHPLAIETMDETLLSLCKTHPLYNQISKYITNSNTNAINILEFKANSKKSLSEITSKFLNNYKKTCLCHFATEIKEKDNKTASQKRKYIWELRNLAVGIAGNMHGNKKPIAFIEDSAIPPEHLTNYVTDLKKLLDSYKLQYVMYGHIDVGCLHVRPALDLRDPKQQKLIPEITTETIKLVKKYNGVIWGEHSSGFRVKFSEEFFGKEIFGIFSQIKSIFDPHNRLNPGKIATPIEKEELFEIASHLKAKNTKKIKPSLYKQFENLLSCNGNTKCLTINQNQVMCPSWKATKEKIHSPKGRANLIEDWLIFRSINKIPRNFIQKMFFKIKHHSYLKQIHSSMNGCLGCNACASNCPLKINIPEYKILFLQWYHQLYIRKPRDYLIANIEALIPFFSKYPAIFNFLFQNKISKLFAQKIFHLTHIPKFNNEFYRANFKHLLPLKPPIKIDRLMEGKKSDKSGGVNRLNKKTVFIVADTFNSFLSTKTLKDSISLLTKLGFEVKIIPLFNSGKSYLNLGFIKKFSKIAQANIGLLNKINALNYPIITIEPVIELLLSNEYKKHFPKKTNYKTQLISELLNQNLKLIKRKNETHNLMEGNKPETPSNINRLTKNIYYFAHCSEQTSIPNSISNWKNIFSAVNIKLQHLESGCCGMAGNYGYEVEHSQSSKKLFQLTWHKHFTKNQASQICATGFSCKEQIKYQTQINTPHPITILNKYIK